MIALLKYGSGLPFNRLEGLQRNLGVPLRASTQWDVIHEPARELSVVYEELIREAAQGEVLHNDDTRIKILELMKENEGEEEAFSELPAERTGMQTTGIISRLGEQKIAVFFSGRRHAGENLDRVLSRRAAELDPPIQMCDGLSHNTPKEFKTVLANCIAHSRRKYVEVAANFPRQCEYVLKKLKAVYKNDAFTKKKKMTPEERLRAEETQGRERRARAVQVPRHRPARRASISLMRLPAAPAGYLVPAALDRRSTSRYASSPAPSPSR